MRESRTLFLGKLKIIIDTRPTFDPTWVGDFGIVRIDAGNERRRLGNLIEAQRRGNNATGDSADRSTFHFACDIALYSCYTTSCNPRPRLFTRGSSRQMP